MLALREWITTFTEAFGSRDVATLRKLGESVPVPSLGSLGHTYQQVLKTLSPHVERLRTMPYTRSGETKVYSSGGEELRYVSDIHYSISLAELPRVSVFDGVIQVFYPGCRMVCLRNRVTRFTFPGSNAYLQVHFIGDSWLRYEVCDLAKIQVGGDLFRLGDQELPSLGSA
jgi:hypothetical protein